MTIDTSRRERRRAASETARGENVAPRRLDPPHRESAPLAPLPLTIFERYMLAADDPEYPMTFIVRMEFTGALDPTAFRNALREAIAREPLFSSHVVDDERGRPCWVAVPDELPWLDMRAWGEPCEFPERASIDLRRETGLRTWVRYNDERAEVRMQCHHACCDGLAIALFLEDLLRLYHRQIEPTTDVEPRELDPRTLVHRERVELPWFKRLQSYAGQALGLSVGWLYWLRRPQRWACPADRRVTPSDERTLPDYPVQSLSAQAIAGLKRVARDEQVSLNELLLGELLITLDAWQQTHATEQRGGLLRVLLPIALRSKEHRLLPAANAVSIALIDRGSFQTRRPKLLLWSLHTELTWLRRTFAPQAFLSWLRCIDKLGWLKKIAQPDDCDATICFTNIGRLGIRSPLLACDGSVVSGGLRLESVHSASPIRRQTPLMITALQYRGALHFGVNYDRRTIDGRAAVEFLTQFLARLEQRACAERVSRERIDSHLLDPRMDDSHHDAPLGTKLISVVIPVYHNARSLPDLVTRLRAVAEQDGRLRWEWIFVDDGSRDDSHTVLTQLQRVEPRMTIVRLTHNHGSNLAVLAGLSVAQGAAVGVISADLQDPPELLTVLLDGWQSGIPLMLAIRAVRHDPWWVSGGARLFYGLLRWLALPQMPPGGFDFCLLDRAAVDELLRRNRATYLAGEVVALGLPLKTMMYTRQPRAARYGRSMWTATKRIRLAWQALALYSRLTPWQWFIGGAGVLLVGVLTWIVNLPTIGLGASVIAGGLSICGALAIWFGWMVRAMRNSQSPRPESMIAAIERAAPSTEAAVV